MNEFQNGSHGKIAAIGSDNGTDNSSLNVNFLFRCFGLLRGFDDLDSRLTVVNAIRISIGIGGRCEFRFSGGERG